MKKKQYELLNGCYTVKVKAYDKEQAIDLIEEKIKTYKNKKGEFTEKGRKFKDFIGQKEQIAKATFEI